MTETIQSTPFVLSLSKDNSRQHKHFDKLSASGSNQGVLLP